MAKAYSVFYIEGLLQQIRPKTTTLWTNKSGIKIHGQSIPWSDIIDFSINYKISDQQGSIAGAAAGAIIAGQTGAIVGGMRSTKKVEPYVTLCYTDNTELHNLVLISKDAEHLQTNYLRHVQKIAGHPKQNMNIAHLKKDSTLKKAGKIYFSPYTYGFKTIKKLTDRNKKQQS